jgi:hypothetical protein
VTASALAPPSPSGPPSRVSVRRARLRDVPRLGRLYVTLSPAARYNYHPFPFNRAAVGLIYTIIALYQKIAGPLMRRWPRFVAVLVVTEIDNVAEPVGSGTLRGERAPSGEPQLRFGFVVREGYRGYGLGKQTLIGLAQQGVELGYQWGVGSIHTSASTVIPLLKAQGWQFSPSDRRDKGAPTERLFGTRIDMRLLATDSARPATA